MSERKVLNKYYPPDFDPTKLPKLKRERNKQFVIRIMAPFSMQCKTCGEYIYKGRKFNSRMETAEGETYLGLRIYRFHIRCTKCISVITFKTDPENTDYTMEHGATRNFEAYKKLEQQITKEKKDREDEETNNPMKALENRTKDSKREMESLEKLEELRDLNQRAAGIDPEILIRNHLKTENEILKMQEAEAEAKDEELVKKMFRGNYSSGGGYLKRIIDDDSDSDGERGEGSGKSSEGSSKSSEGSSKSSEESSKSLENDIASSDYLIADLIPHNLPGPAKPPPKKSKLKTPFDDLSSMIIKKAKPKEEKKNSEGTKSGSNIVVEKPKVSVNVPDVPDVLPLPLPTYKINLKKPDNKNDRQMKGTSLSLLGGYNSSEGSSEDE